MNRINSEYKNLLESVWLIYLSPFIKGVRQLIMMTGMCQYLENKVANVQIHVNMNDKYMYKCIIHTYNCASMSRCN